MKPGALSVTVKQHMEREELRDWRDVEEQTSVQSPSEHGDL